QLQKQAQQHKHKPSDSRADWWIGRSKNSVRTLNTLRRRRRRRKARGRLGATGPCGFAPGAPGLPPAGRGGTAPCTNCARAPRGEAESRERRRAKREREREKREETSAWDDRIGRPHNTTMNSALRLAALIRQTEVLPPLAHFGGWSFRVPKSLHQEYPTELKLLLTIINTYAGGHR
ncbi:unnamed protein product, partial [Prorocentrum cordatum]